MSTSLLQWSAGYTANWHDVFSYDHNQAVANWTAGAHTLEIAYREDGALLDAIVISKTD